MLKTRVPFYFPIDIEGYSSPSECEWLYDLACQADGTIVELGTYKGRTAVSMAMSGNPVYAIDRFAPESGEFRPYPDHRDGNFSADLVRENAQRHGVQVTVIDGDSAQEAYTWAHGDVSLLFIDAGHDYEDVKADFEAWEPLLTDDAVVVFDDVLWPGVMRFINELDDWTPIPGEQPGGMTAMRRI